MLLNKDLFFFIYFFLGLVTIPTGVFYLLGTSSMYHGLLIYNGLLVLLILFLRKMKFDRNILNTVNLFFIFIFMYTLLLMCFVYSYEMDYLKLIISFLTIVTLIIIIILIPIVDYLHHVNEKTLQGSLDTVFYILTLFALYASIYHILFLSDTIVVYTDKSFLIYTEPSHFALVVLPLLFYFVQRQKKLIQLVILFIYLIFAYIIQSLLLLVGTLFILLFILLQFKTLFVILLPIFIALTYILNFDYFLSRIDITREITNLSILVYFSGWERAFLALKESLGLGIGFQQLGVFGEQGYFMEIVSEISGKFTNQFDGSFLASKLIAEFGFLGIIFCIMYIIGFIKVFFLLLKRKPEKVSELFVYSMYIMFMFELFVRGIGYFSPTFFLFILSTMYILFVPEQSLHNKNIGEKI